MAGTTATDKKVSKLEAKVERQEAMIDRLKGRIAAGKVKSAARREAKAASGRTATRTPPKRRKATRSAQTSASA